MSEYITISRQRFLKYCSQVLMEHLSAPPYPLGLPLQEDDCSYLCSRMLAALEGRQSDLASTNPP